MPPEYPAALGYHMPAEWEPHAATWLAWPHNRETWPDNLDEVQAISVRLLTILQGHETVHLFVNDATTADHVRRLLAAAGLPQPDVVMHIRRTVDAWLRDSGPTFVIAREHIGAPLALVDWRFTAWGAKYPEMLADDDLPRYIAAHFTLPRFRPGIVLEGGSIDVNGHGTCLTTEQCLLRPNRNPHLSRQQIERMLQRYLGVQHVIWLGAGIAGDDTDGHVDDIARFVNPTTVVCALNDDPSDPNYAALQENYQRLQAATDQDGRPLDVIPLPMPGLIGSEAEPLPASYANFYIANGVVLVPTYAHPHDQEALRILQTLFPERQVIGIPCEPLVWGLGALHCITQQQPAA
jgi:agmatine deiminase